MRHITHQMQPCNVSCMSTCLAMLLDEPAEGVIEQLHEKYRSGTVSLRALFDELSVPFKSFDSCDLAPLIDVGAYMVTVPSLNIQGGMHQIIIEVTEDDYFVVDPVKGREGKLYYGRRNETFPADDEIELGGFIVDAFVDAEWLQGRGL